MKVIAAALPSDFMSYFFIRQNAPDGYAHTSPAPESFITKATFAEQGQFFHHVRAF